MGSPCVGEGRGEDREDAGEGGARIFIRGRVECPGYVGGVRGGVVKTGMLLCKIYQYKDQSSHTCAYTMYQLVPILGTIH